MLYKISKYIERLSKYIKLDNVQFDNSCKKSLEKMSNSLEHPVKIALFGDTLRGKSAFWNWLVSDNIVGISDSSQKKTPGSRKKMCLMPLVSCLLINFSTICNRRTDQNSTHCQVWREEKDSDNDKRI